MHTLWTEIVCNFECVSCVEVARCGIGINTRFRNPWTLSSTLAALKMLLFSAFGFLNYMYNVHAYKYEFPVPVI